MDPIAYSQRSRFLYPRYFCMAGSREVFMTAAQFHCMTIFWSSAAVLAICNCEISDGAYIHMHVHKVTQKWHNFRTPYYVVKYRPIFKLFSLSESGDSL